MSNRKQKGSSAQHHQRSAEIHLAASQSHGKQDHQTGTEHSRQAQEHNGQNHDDVALRAHGLWEGRGSPEGYRFHAVQQIPR